MHSECHRRVAAAPALATARDEMRRCILRNVRDWRTPAIDGELTLRVPLGY